MESFEKTGRFFAALLLVVTTACGAGAKVSFRHTVSPAELAKCHEAFDDGSAPWTVGCVPPGGSLFIYAAKQSLANEQAAAKCRGLSSWEPAEVVQDRRCPSDPYRREPRGWKVDVFGDGPELELVVTTNGSPSRRVRAILAARHNVMNSDSPGENPRAYIDADRRVSIASAEPVATLDVDECDVKRPPPSGVMSEQCTVTAYYVLRDGEHGNPPIKLRAGTIEVRGHPSASSLQQGPPPP